MKKIIGLMLAVLLYACNNDSKRETGTSIFVLVKKDSIWFCADTRSKTVVKGKEKYVINSKIYKSGSIYYGFSNMVVYLPFYDANKKFEEILARTKNMEKGVLLFDKYFVSIGNKMISKLKKEDYPEYLRYVNNDTMSIMSMIAVAFVNGKPYLQARSYFIKRANNKDFLTITSNIPKPPPMYHSIGYHDHLDLYWKSLRLPHSPVFRDLAYRSIEIECEQHSEVGKPIDMLVITAAGHRWLTDSVTSHF